MPAQQRSQDWKDSTKRDTVDTLAIELDKLLKTSAPSDSARWEKEFEGFRHLFNRFLKVKPTINWQKIEPLPMGAIRSYDSLPPPAPDKIKDLLSKLVVVKLNGGLGTSMGCQGPKSLINVRDDLTFLDLTMHQIDQMNVKYEVKVPLVLMNSFNTDEDTVKSLEKYKRFQVEPYTFSQSRYPRINKKTLMPIAGNLQGDDLESWYPPGHGNFYEAFVNSGLVDNFINEGKEYCFLSNVDNVGATVDLSILNFLLGGSSEAPEFLMEVTDKTSADVKGGTLIQYDGRLMLLEIAQVPKENQDEFKSVSKFKIFNTNNLWVSLGAIKRVVESNTLDMEVIVNPKFLEQGIEIVQLETAAGAAIKAFNNAIGVNVPRNRFLPVKKCSDLLLVMSNLYELENAQLTVSSKRSFPTIPLIKLGSSFDKVSEFNKRFSGVPDILELDHLTVEGNVWFGKNVVLKGTVIIIANHGDRIDIPTSAVLENKIVLENKVSGNLRILDH